MILEYHSFSEEPTEYLYNRTYRQFSIDLKSKFDIITMDDGHKGQRKACDMIDEKGFIAILSIVPSFIGQENYLTWDELKLISRRHKIANHTVTHRPITKLSFEEVMKEILEANQIIYNKIGVTCLYFTPPYNEITPELVLRIRTDFGLIPIIGRITITKDMIL